MKKIRDTYNDTAKVTYDNFLYGADGRVYLKVTEKDVKTELSLYPEDARALAKQLRKAARRAEAAE